MSGLPSIKVNGGRLQSTLLESCQWGSTPDGGMNRLSLNDDDKLVREWFIEKTKLYGCSHKIDQIGNIFAIRDGVNNSLPPIGMGSHLDTQPSGGKYDGIVGVLSALEVLRILHENNITTYAPIAVINWTNEEGARYAPAMMGSGVWCGVFDVSWAHSCSDLQGVKLGDELKRIGFMGDTPASYESNSLSAHFEVHIEQGPRLEAENLPVGLVTGVQAINWCSVELRGQEQHAGTTPMNMRADTLLCAAQMIVKINEVTLDTPGGLATVAVINSSPQSVNTLAGRVQFNIDMRAEDDDILFKLEQKIQDTCYQTAGVYGVKIEKWDKFWTSPKTTFDPTAVSMVRDSAKEADIKFKELQSGAGHDSVYASRRCPAAMIFIRSKGGISHNPVEYSSEEDLEAGAQVLLGAVLRYDAHLRSQSK